MDNHSSTTEVQSLSNDLVVLSARLVREVRRHNADIPAASTRLLSPLDELGPSTVGGLAEADRISQPSTSAHVNALVEKGWVRRDPHPDDARACLVSMTDEGRRQLRGLRRRNAALVADRMSSSGHSPAELATAVAVLSDLLERK